MSDSSDSSNSSNRPKVIIADPDGERVKPRIVEFVEKMEAQHEGELEPDFLTDACCISVAQFFFGPLTENELQVYASVIKTRLHQYRMSIN